MRVPRRVLPCQNAQEIVQQVRPTIDLLRGLDESHPEVLIEAGVDPAAYHGGNVFRSAVETIRGSYISNQTVPREGMVGTLLGRMKQSNLLANYEQMPRGIRWDFTAELETNPRREVAIEVKGGEGNSLNLSNRPPHVQEFMIWCHLDGSIQHDAAKGVQAIIGRIVADIIKGYKHIDALIVRDRLCGTLARPCPKYADRAMPAIGPAPDIFLFPQAIPMFGRDPHPPVHTEETCIFPFRLLDLFGVSAEDRPLHVHTVDIRLFLRNEETMREVIVSQNGVEQFRKSSPWKARS